MSELQILKLSDLANQIARVLNASFRSQTFWVVAEVFGHKFYPDTDRHFFSLIEKGPASNDPVAKFSAKAWKAGSQKIDEFEKLTGQKFHDGLEVLVNIKVDYNASHGLSLTLLAINETFTLGNLEKQRRETRCRLVEENDFISVVDGVYSTRNKKARLNRVIQRIAVIGSPNSEGYVDFVHTLKNNQFGYRFAINTYYSSVQGMLAEDELIESLIAIYRSQQLYDCVAIIRGGGAKADFLVFNQYKLSRAVAKFPIPIVTGIGHQNDVSIVDMMAHTNTKTPTKSAEFIIAHCRAFEDELIENHNRIINRIQDAINENKQRYHSASIDIIQACTKRLADGKDNLATCKQSLIKQSQRIPNGEQKKINGLFVRVLNNANASINEHHRHIGALKGNYSHICYRLVVNKKNILRSSASHLIEATKSDMTSAQRNMDEWKSKASTYCMRTIMRHHSHLHSRAYGYTVHVKESLVPRSEDLIRLKALLGSGVFRYLAKNSYELKNRSIIINTADPISIMKKGFALISKCGRIISHAEGIDTGDKVGIEFFDGKLSAMITSKEE